MKRRVLYSACLAALVSAALGSAGASARVDATPGATPGVTPTSILIGGTVPLTGAASAYASIGRGADAYFKYLNARGGVNGRRITYRILDDAYNPALTVQQTRQLVQEEKVFAVFNSLGTEHNLAIRPFLNQMQVPQVFAATGASTFGTDYRRYPWTIGYQPSYVAEGAMYGRYLVGQRPGARVAVLVQNDDYGKDLVNGLRQGLGKSGRIVAQEGYEATATDVSSQIAKLKDSGARNLVLVATPAFAIRAYIAVNKLGWKPQIIVNTVASATNTMKIAALSSGQVAEGSVSVGFLKDPTDPRWSKDAGIRLYRQIMKQYGSGDANDVYNVYAMASAHTFVTALRKAGKNLTRESLIRALTSLDERDNPFLLPGVTVRTSATDRFPIEQVRLQRWTKGRWTLVS
ncbi:MAG: ABC transporter substrate-binding protein [Actinobacteria bacterium]|nr:ABC transporter substrate-binding protein [Actinomycetota bacterium]